MLGIIAIDRKKASRCAFKLWCETDAGLPLCFLEIYRKKRMGNMRLKHRIKKAVRALVRTGVTRVAVIGQGVFPLLETVLMQYGIVLVQDHTLRIRLAGKLAIAASRKLNIDREKLGVEVVCGGALQITQAAALEAFSHARYTACWGRGADELRRRAGEKLGVAAIENTIPIALCDGIIRIDFTGNPQLLSIWLRDGSYYRLERFRLELPERFSTLYDEIHQISAAAALVESGMLRISEIQIRSVEICQVE